MIIVETPDTILSYFIKYIPTNNWLLSKQELSTFSGNIEIYSYEGNLLNTYSLDNGLVKYATAEANPCFPDGFYGNDSDNNNDTNNDTSGGTGGGSGSDAYSNDDSGGGLNYDPWGGWTSGSGFYGAGSGESDEIANACSGSYCVVCDNELVGVNGCSCEKCHGTWRYASIALETTTDPNDHFEVVDCVDVGVINFLTTHLNLTDEQFNWLTSQPNVPIMVDIINFIGANANADYTIPQEISDFAQQAIEALISGQVQTFEQFVKWFGKDIEGQDFFYDAIFWEDPNLTFPQQDLPSWDDYNNSYPRNSADELYMQIGDAVLNARIEYPDDTDDTCALRVSAALNGAGVVIPQISNNPNLPGTLRGDDGKYYFLNAKALNIWMRKTFGTNPATATTPLNTNHKHFNTMQIGVNGADFLASPSMNNTKGIYSMVLLYPNSAGNASGHADIFENKDPYIQFALQYEIDYIDIWILN